MNDYQRFIFASRYARWLEDKGRRETWQETVTRYITFMQEHLGDKAEYIDWNELYLAIHDLEVLPSMRALMTAGPALKRDNIAGYNCAYLPVDTPRAFDEAMYVLMCGTGVGFSVERQYVNQLPEVSEHFERTDTTISVKDSKAGWSRAFRELIALLYSGQEPSWDLGSLRPAGARLVTFGGRSSGPEPLDQLFRFTVEIFRKAAGRKLTSLECHDLMCKVGEVVVVGGVRRSAMISLSNLSDDRMRNAKQGQWWELNPQRALSNNSACYLDRPDPDFFLEEWTNLYKSKSGERGIYNRGAAQRQAARSGRRLPVDGAGCNPCSEIILRPNEFCNLTEVVVRSTDTQEDLEKKVRIATILGTIQSTLTDFKYIRNVWRKNCEEERLLGVSLTGILDHPSLLWKQQEQLNRLKETAIETNRGLADLLNINQSVAITCVKPSGTVSQLVDSASGIHPRWSPWYVRTIRGDVKDPMTVFLKDQGVPWEADVMKPKDTVVFSFPQKAPEGALCRKDLTALDHLEIWKQIQDSWCEHKPSITVNVKDDEWIKVAAWVYDNFDCLSGVSFLPYSEHTYKQAPYQEITEEEYNEWTQKMPASIEWDRLSEYEVEDNTTGSQEFACSGSSCDII